MLFVPAIDRLRSLLENAEDGRGLRMLQSRALPHGLRGACDIGDLFLVQVSGRSHGGEGCR